MRGICRLSVDAPPLPALQPLTPSHPPTHLPPPPSTHPLIHPPSTTPSNAHTHTHKGHMRNNYMSNVHHDDVIKWKHFPRYWPFVRGIHRSRWIPHTKASDAELWCLPYAVDLRRHGIHCDVAVIMNFRKVCRIWFFEKSQMDVLCTPLCTVGHLQFERSLDYEMSMTPET